jgi:hypothetical protein
MEMTRKWWICLGLVWIVLLAGCARGDQDPSDVQVDLAIEPSPPRVGPASILITLRDAGGQLISGATIELEGDMNHAGMVPVLAQASEVAAGQYQATLEFTMAGDWFVLVRADLPDGRSIEHRVDFAGSNAVQGDMSMP